MLRKQQALYLICFLIISLQVNGYNSLSPIFFIPGMVTSKLQVSLHEEALLSIPPECWRNGSFIAWLDVAQYLNPRTSICLYYYLRMVYNETSREYENAPGIIVETVSFGLWNSTLADIPFAGKSLLMAYEGYHNALGYKLHKDFFFIPYDWRRGALSIIYKTSFRADLKALIEKAFHLNGQKKIFFLSHSNGPLLVHQFLLSMSSQWKQKYIQASIFLSGNWIGQFNSLGDITYNGDFDLPLILYDNQKGAELIRSLESMIYTMPSYSIFQNDYWMSIAGKNYTVSQTADYLELKYPMFFSVFLKNWRQIKPDLRHPGVDVYNFYGIQVPTVRTFVFANENILGSMPISKGYDNNGDGDQGFEDNSAINTIWNQTKEFIFQYREFKHVDHMNEPSHPNIIQAVVDIIKAYDMLSQK
jgi:hypothetical protein